MHASITVCTAAQSGTKKVTMRGWAYSSTTTTPGDTFVLYSSKIFVPLLTCVNKKLKLSVEYESYFLQINIIVFQLLL